MATNAVRELYLNGLCPLMVCSYLQEVLDQIHFYPKLTIKAVKL